MQKLHLLYFTSSFLIYFHLSEGWLISDIGGKIVDNVAGGVKGALKYPDAIVENILPKPFKTGVIQKKPNKLDETVHNVPGKIQNKSKETVTKLPVISTSAPEQSSNENPPASDEVTSAAL